MKRALRTAMALLSLAVPALAVPVASGGGAVCTGALGTVTINRNVTAGPGCDLSNTRVNGNVTVIPGGSLRVNPGSTTSISGNVQGHNAAFVLILSGTIGGNVEVEGASPPAGVGTTVASGTVKGNIDIRNGAAHVAVSGETVGGNVKVHGNAGSNLPGDIGDVEVVQNVIAGNVDVYGNLLTGSAFNLVNTLYNAIGGNLSVRDNVATGGSVENIANTQSNTVGGNVDVRNNSATGPAGAINAIRVTINVVSGNLDCRGNDPAPTGGGNTAKQKKGECAGL